MKNKSLHSCIAIFLFIILFTSGCTHNLQASPALVAGQVESFAISVNEDGTINVQGQPDESYDFSDWTNIKSVSVGSFNAAGVKKDGTVVVTGSNDYGACNVHDWKDIVMVEFTDFAAYGLKKDGTIVYTTPNKKSYFCQDIAAEVDTWRSIKSIDACDIDVVGVTENGRVYHAEGFKREYEPNISNWRNVKSVSIAYGEIVAQQHSGEVLVSKGGLSLVFDADYTQPYDDMAGAVKVCVLDTCIAGLMSTVQ